MLTHDILNSHKHTYVSTHTGKATIANLATSIPMPDHIINPTELIDLDMTVKCRLQ